MHQASGKRFYSLLLITYAFALVICGATRILLKLRFMDAETGFYQTDTGWVTVFNLGLLAAVVILFLATRLRQTTNDYPVARSSRLAGGFCSLSGLAMMAYVLIQRPIYPDIEQMYSDAMIAGRDLLCIGLGVLSGLSMVWLGACMMRGKLSRAVMVPALLPAIWQMFMLVSRFNGFTVLTTITDNLLAVLFMCAAALFLIGQARTLFGLSYKDGHNYVIPAGLCTSLFGLVLVVPNAVYMLVYQKVHIPAPMLGFWESLYVLALSFYGVCFAVNTIRSIEQV